MAATGSDAEQSSGSGDKGPPPQPMPRMSRQTAQGWFLAVTDSNLCTGLTGWPGLLILLQNNQPLLSSVHFTVFYTS